jgi:2-polyprenyl-6-methoxyphenol hydroxylase-like FAD-dependent oxidoreductase
MAEPVVIVGAGPVGLTAALELARFDVPSIVLETKPHLAPEGSRAIVLARHTLETFERLGCAAEILNRGVVLDRARTYFRERELFCVEFPPSAAGEPPRFMNLQQTYTERALFERVQATPCVDVRFGTTVSSLDELEPGSFVIACDGARSKVRELLGIPFLGKSFDDRFLIADIRATLAFPNERRFFFDPPSNPGRQVLIHPQPDAEWRIDWQVPGKTDPERELTSGRLERRIRALIGDAPYELAWLTAYRFHQRLADRFRAGHIFLAGDAAHLMSVFGARGMNSGVEDAVNLAWKVAFVWHGWAPETLLDTYEQERRPAARENLRITGATMRFMAPPTRAHKLLRDAVLRGSVHSRAIRRLVNSGRLAEPAVYRAQGSTRAGRMVPTNLPTDPVQAPYSGFRVARDRRGGLLIRPDGYVTAELPDLEAATVKAALRSALRLP